jgi:small GTP-binding protein
MNLGGDEFTRVVLIGDSGVGKTSLITRLVSNKFASDEPSTVGAMFVIHEVNVDGFPIKLQIWDTAGQEKFRSLGPIYYRNSKAGIVVFDLTSPKSFSNVDGWINDFCNTAGADAVIFIVGNKIDLEPVVSLDEAHNWASKKGYRFYTTSSLSGTGINELFNAVGKVLVETKCIKIVPTEIDINKAKSNSCC